MALKKEQKDLTLEEKLQQSIKDATPIASMVPENLFGPPPKKEEEVIPDIVDVIPLPVDRAKVIRLVAEHVRLGDIEKQAKKSRKPVTASLKVLISKYKVGKFNVGPARVNYYNAPRRSLSDKKLMELGVSPLIIAQCWVTKDSYTLKIGPAGQEKEEDENGDE